MGKRNQEQDSGRQAKRPKLSTHDEPTPTDFPRGGGTSLTPSEVKSLKVEGKRQANDLFKDSKKSTGGPSHRIEHLTFKNLATGMKILGQIVAVFPLALVISLPNQLYGHVPITNISTQLTSLLEKLDDIENSDPDNLPEVPQLSDLFSPGQYVRTHVTALGQTKADITGLSKSREDAPRQSRKIELSLVPEHVNSGIQLSDLVPSFPITAAVQSAEDHGYILDFGISNLNGFLPSKDAKKYISSPEAKLWVGQIINVTVSKIKQNGRTCTVTMDPQRFTSTNISQVTTASSLLPGMQVQCLITDSHSFGVTLQVLGYFEGSMDPSHLAPSLKYPVGKKIKARILYATSSSPPRFALATLEHILHLESSLDKGSQEHPVGQLLDSVIITRIDSDHGVFVEFGKGQSGFIHISHVSDDHVPSLPAGKWRMDSSHKARITGFHPFDQVFQLSMKASILDQKFLRLEDVKVGQIVRGTVKSLKENALFVALSDNLDGVVWPNHYADVPLNNPGRRFREGSPLKCKVLLVDHKRHKLYLTCKKALIESNLPTISQPKDIQIGLVTHAVVFKVFEKYALVEFFNNLQGFVPSTEVSDDLNQGLSALPLGRVVKVRIIAFDESTSQITASIRQARVQEAAPIDSLEVGHIVEGTVLEVHKDNTILALNPSGVRAILSLDNLANHRGIAPIQIRTSLKAGEVLPNLVVVSRNPSKGFVIVANKPKAQSTSSISSVTLDTVNLGEMVVGRVTRHLPHGVLLKISPHLGAIIHRTDLSDNYDIDSSLPPVDTILKAAVVAIDRGSRQLSLSKRKSRLDTEESGDIPIVDPEIENLETLKSGARVRGFVKQIADHGLFVCVGRNITARVQIRELFDEFVKDWKPRFQVGQVISGKIQSLDSTNNRVELTLRSDLSRAKTEKSLTLSSLSPGDKIAGTVTRVEEYGLFIVLDNSKLSGLCHKSELSDNTEADLSAALGGFRKGDRVQTLILRIDKNRISLSLKQSHFGTDHLDDTHLSDLPNEDVDMDDSSPPSPIVLHPEEEESDDEEEEESDAEPEPELQVNMVIDEVNVMADDVMLPLKGGFDWSAKPADEDDDFLSDGSSDAAGSENGTTTLSRKKKKRSKVILHDLTADLEKSLPQSNNDFERMLLSSPDSSFLWMKYMSFQLQLSEIDKAREIARRALRTISFREEQERLNVWLALLNLENAYGTTEELDKTFKEAARANDSKTIYLRLAAIFEESGKLEMAQEQFQKTCKKFGGSSKAWTLFGEYHFRQDNIEAARAILPRSFQSLEKRKHLKTVSQFAQFEYKLGEPERGKTIFEGIVESHPKRWDLWSVYLDMEATREDIQSIRALFERIFLLKLTTHKAKFFFKKWLNLEKKLGDDAGEATVKENAVAWTRNAAV